MESVEKALREVDEFSKDNFVDSARISVVKSRNERFQPTNDKDWHIYRAIMHGGFYFDLDEGISAIRELDRIVSPLDFESHQRDGYPKINSFRVPADGEDYYFFGNGRSMPDRWNTAIFSYTNNPNHLIEEAPGHPSGFQFELAQNYSPDHFGYYPDVPRLDGILQALDKVGVIEFLPDVLDEDFAKEYADRLKSVKPNKDYKKIRMCKPCQVEFFREHRN